MKTDDPWSAAAQAERNLPSQRDALGTAESAQAKYRELQEARKNETPEQRGEREARLRENEAAEAEARREQSEKFREVEKEYAAREEAARPVAEQLYEDGVAHPANRDAYLKQLGEIQKKWKTMSPDERAHTLQ